MNRLPRPESTQGVIGVGCVAGGTFWLLGGAWALIVFGVMLMAGALMSARGAD